MGPELAAHGQAILQIDLRWKLSEVGVQMGNYVMIDSGKKDSVPTLSWVL